LIARPSAQISKTHVVRAFLGSATSTAFVAFSVLSTFSTGTAATETAVTDPICAPLRAFVASVQPGESKKIEFHTRWGSNFEGAAIALGAATCAHAHGDGVGRAVCTALSEHGSTERSDLNAVRALECLAPGTYFGQVLFEAGSFSLSSGTPDRGAKLNVSFVDDADHGGKVLRIVAKGY
jgi:hypothetical protein